MAELGEYLSTEFWLDRRYTVAYVATGVLAFFIFVFTNFPYDDALSSLLAPAHLKVAYADQRMSLPIGVRLQDVQLISTTASVAPLARSQEVTIEPALGSLVLLRPGLRIASDLYGGRVAISASRRSGGLGVTFTAAMLDLQSYGGLKGFVAGLGGHLDAAGSFDLRDGDPMTNSGATKIAGHGLFLRLANGMPQVQLGDLTGDLSLAKGVLIIDHLDSHGGDVAIEGSGTIRLGASFADSQIDATVRLVPTPAASARLGMLFGLLPHPPPMPYRIRGPLLAPSIS